MEYCAPIICANYKHPVKRKDGHECTKNQNEIKSYFAENPKIIRIFFNRRTVLTLYPLLYLHPCGLKPAY